MKVGSALLGASLSVTALSTAAEPATGLLAQTVCISPAVFAAALVFPPERIISVVENRLQVTGETNDTNGGHR